MTLSISVVIRTASTGSRSISTAGSNSWNTGGGRLPGLFSAHTELEGNGEPAAAALVTNCRVAIKVA